ncbi:MAG: hypothetical protein ABW321_20285, partial [Polyangiales bacterium]
MGRVVDLQTFTQGPLLGHMPEYELNDVAGDIGVTMDWSGRLVAAQLSTASQLWADDSGMSCYRVVLNASRVYANCHQGLFAYDWISGEKHLIARNDPTLEEIALHDSLLILKREAGVVTLLDEATGKTRAQKQLGELVGTSSASYLLPSPAGPGVCVLGERESDNPQNAHVHRLACYDDKLRRRWSRVLRYATAPSERHFHLAYVGARHIVLDDEGSSD